MAEKQPRVLRFMGMMGHEFAVIRPSGDDWERAGEFNDLTRAIEHANSVHGRVYQARIDKRGVIKYRRYT